MEYIKAGGDLTFALSHEFDLCLWSGSQMVFTDAENASIDKFAKFFTDASRHHARQQGGEEFLYHPEFWPYIQRTLVGYGLRRCGRGRSQDDWKSAVTAYLKAWSMDVDPQSWLDIATLLGGAGHHERARDARNVAKLFFPYARSRPPEDIKETTVSAITVGAFVVGFEPDGGIFNERFLASLKQQLAI